LWHNKQVSFPLYITATALGKLGHPDGELAIARAASINNIIYMLPTLSSYSFDEMFEAGREQGVKNVATRAPGSPFSGETTQWMQLYVNRDRALTKKIVQKAEGMGVKALFITVDAPQLGMGFSLFSVLIFDVYFSPSLFIVCF
jgi:L-lactate dehydrogenase (cytochrome)